MFPLYKEQDIRTFCQAAQYVYVNVQWGGKNELMAARVQQVSAAGYRLM